MWYRAPSPLLPVSRPLGCQGARGASGGHCRLASSGRSAGPRGRGLTPGTNASQGPSPAPPTPTAGNPQKRPTKQNLWFVAPQLVGQHRRLPLPQGGWGRAVGTQATHPSPRGGLGSRRCPPHSLHHCPPPPVPQAGLGTGCWLLGPPQPHGLCPHRGLHPPRRPPQAYLLPQECCFTLTGVGLSPPVVARRVTLTNQLTPALRAWKTFFIPFAHMCA